MTHLELLLERDDFGDTYTLGRLDIDGLHFGCVVEDVDRGLDSMMPANDIAAIKVRGVTAIPTGRYRLGVRWSPKHKRFVLYLIGVPGFQYIEIHTGNHERDTDGCLCVGLNRNEEDEVNRIGGSARAVKWLEDHYLEGIKAGTIVGYITITRSAAWKGKG